MGEDVLTPNKALRFLRHPGGVVWYPPCPFSFSFSFFLGKGQPGIQPAAAQSSLSCREEKEEEGAACFLAPSFLHLRRLDSDCGSEGREGGMWGKMERRYDCIQDFFFVETTSW